MWSSVSRESTDGRGERDEGKTLGGVWSRDKKWGRCVTYKKKVS